MRNNVFVDIHAIQTVPPSNINRDDTGRPKTAEYGGVTRARVSSQSWKKAVREFFKEKNTGERAVGIRSLRLVTLIADQIRIIDENISEEKALEMADSIFKSLGISTKEVKGEKDKKLKALFFISELQAKKLAQVAVDSPDAKYDKKTLKEIMNSNKSIDIALFGRMVADDPTLNVDASAQVAHAISTHPVETEFDFFTATDDLSPEDNAGAGMLGTIEFNSSTLYRYANIAAHELIKQLNNDKEATIDAIKLFLEAFILSMPTGKVNTFANQTLPQGVVISIREDRPVNLVSAFEVPVYSNEGYVDKSKDKLKTEYHKVLKFVEEPAYTFTLGISDLGEETENLKDMLEKVTIGLSEVLS